MTLSSDAGKTKPAHVLMSLRSCLRAGFSIDLLLPLVTTNPAAALKLQGVGKLEKGAEASLGIYEPYSLELVSLFSKGHAMVRDGKPIVKSRYREESDRDLSRDANVVHT